MCTDWAQRWVRSRSSQPPSSRAPSAADRPSSLRAVPRHLWTAEHVFPDLSADFQALRRDLGLRATPLNVILSGSGQLDLSLPVFAKGAVETLIVTTEAGAARLAGERLPSGVSVRAAAGGAGSRVHPRVCVGGGRLFHGAAQEGA